MLSQFFLRLAFGMLAALLLLSPGQINPRFYRTQFLTALTNFKAATIDADVAKIKSFAVGDFRSQVDQVFGAGFFDRAKQAEVVSTGKVRSVFVESISGANATVNANDVTNCVTGIGGPHGMNPGASGGTVSGNFVYGNRSGMAQHAVAKDDELRCAAANVEQAAAELALILRQAGFR